MALPSLTAERGLAFRITHVSNIPWILDHGLHCRTSNILDANYHEIGNPELIGRRAQRAVPIPPGGTLSDYIPFYFTPRTPMLYNIVTGYSGMRQTPRPEIVIVVASLPRLVELGVPFVVADRHAYLVAARFSSGTEGLGDLDWERLRACNFKRDPEDPGRFERYQAEALVHRHLRLEAIDGLVCYRDETREVLAAELRRRRLSLPLTTEPDWYC